MSIDSFILMNRMVTNKEYVFVVGAAELMRTDLVRSLTKKDIDTAVYVRGESREIPGHLTSVADTYSIIRLVHFVLTI